MVRSSKGFRRATRQKLKKKFRHKFKPEDYLKEFKESEKVVLANNPSSHKGMPHPKLKGRVGEVASRRGNSYVVNVRVGGATKQIITRPEHLKSLGGK